MKEFFKSLADSGIAWLVIGNGVVPKGRTDMTDTPKLLTEAEWRKFWIVSCGISSENIEKLIRAHRERGMIAPEPEPVDPLLIEAREICVKYFTSRNYSQTVIDGLCDDDGVVQIALAALRRNLELAERPTFTPEKVREAVEAVQEWIEPEPEPVDPLAREADEIADAVYAYKDPERAYAKNAALTTAQAEADALRAEVERLREALEFYADPETYHGCAFLFDRPTGGFDDDFDSDHGHEDYNRPMPGKLARAALSEKENGNG
jgi:hypothetical protein